MKINIKKFCEAGLIKKGQWCNISFSVNGDMGHFTINGINYPAQITNGEWEPVL